jgi:hypothetical protein
MLYTIILTVILLIVPAGQRAVEEERRITVELPEGHPPTILPMECQKNGTIEIEKWLKENPGYKVLKWRCPQPGKEELDT